MVLKLYGVSDGPPSLSVRQALTHLQIPFELVSVDFGAGDHMTPEYALVNTLSPQYTLWYSANIWLAIWTTFKVTICPDFSGHVRNSGIRTPVSANSPDILIFTSNELKNVYCEWTKKIYHLTKLIMYLERIIYINIVDNYYYNIKPSAINKTVLLSTPLHQPVHSQWKEDPPDKKYCWTLFNPL